MTELLTITECSALLRLSERWVYQMARNQMLPGAAKIGGKWRFDKAKILAFVANGGELAEQADATEKSRGNQ
jgi:putative molybdopterin biosynthesis protein